MENAEGGICVIFTTSVFLVAWFWSLQFTILEQGYRCDPLVNCASV